MLVPWIMSLGPTGPAVREATAASNSGYGSTLSEIFTVQIFVIEFTLEEVIYSDQMWTRAWRHCHEALHILSFICLLVCLSVRPNFVTRFGNFPFHTF